jgi:hypothetical protein
MEMKRDGCGGKDGMYPGSQEGFRKGSERLGKGLGRKERMEILTRLCL